MDAYISLDMIFRWTHVLFGIAWIGLLYYFNFVQTEYFKEAEPSAKSDAVAKLAPRALWWFRWGAMITFLSGLFILLLKLHVGVPLGSGYITRILTGALMGTFMWANVWFIIFSTSDCTARYSTIRSLGFSSP